MSAEDFNPFGLFSGVWIPDFLVAYAGISPAAKICYARLARYCGRKSNVCWPSQKELSEELGVSERSVGSYLQELEVNGFIVIERQGLQKTNHYRLTKNSPIVEAMGGTLSDLDRKDSSDQDKKDSSDPDQRDSSDPLHLSYEESHSKESHSTSVVELLRIHNRTKGSKKAGMKDRADFHEWLLQRSETGDEIEGAFRLFCEDPYWIERKLPLRAFRDQFSKYLQRQQEDPRPIDGQDPAAGSPVLEPEDAWNVSVALDYLFEWNKRVPLAITDYAPGVDDRRLVPLMTTDPEFQGAFEKICKISQGIRENKPDSTWLDFYWLARTKTGGAMVNWRRVLTTMRGMAIPEKSRIVPETEGQRSSREAHERNEKRRAEAGPMEPITSIEQLIARAAKKVVISE